MSDIMAQVSELPESSYFLVELYLYPLLKEYENRISYLEKLAEDRLLRINELEAMVEKLEGRIRELLRELAWWKKYALVLEKTRRIGYYNQGKGVQQLCWGVKSKLDNDEF